MTMRVCLCELGSCMSIMTGFLKIAGDAFAQVACFPDVDDGTTGVFEEVAAGARWQRR